MRRDREKGANRYCSKKVTYGTESLEKEVNRSGNSGRVYLPPSWVGKRVIIRMNEEVLK